LPTPRQLGAFVGGQYVNNIIGNAATFAAPLVVVDVLGTRQAAYFNVPWLVILTMQTLLWNILTPFLVHSARRPDQAREHARRALRIGAPVVGLGTVALVAGAPVVLDLQGAAFATAGTPLLRVVALSFPATAVIVFATGYALLERRLWRLVAIRTPGAICFLGGSALLLPRLGVVAGGIVYVGVQTAVAAALLPGLLGRIRLGAVPAEPVPAAGRVPADDRNDSS
jgi:O-antigen/teichoic acid export membrane protein